MSLRRQKYDKKYRREKFHVKITAKLGVTFDSMDEEDPWWMDGDDIGPTGSEFKRSRLLLTLIKLNIKEAAELLDTLYWLGCIISPCEQ